MQPIIRPSLYGLGLTLLWAFLAFAKPATTYHLAPFLVSVAVPVGAALADVVDFRAAVVASGIGLTLTLGAAAVLGATDHLTGPSLLPFGGAVVEAVVFGGLGAVGGLIPAISSHR